MALLALEDVLPNLKAYSLKKIRTGVAPSKELDVFIASDQPEECRKLGCGHRTDFIDIKPGTQLHRCPTCGYTFLVEEDTEEEAA